MTNALRPALSKDFDFFLDGLEQGRFLVQRCNDCQATRYPPGPMCPECNSLKWSAQPLSGAGEIYSFVVHHYPPIPPFETPLPIVLADMAEGVRIMAPFGGGADTLHVGAPVQLEFRPDGKTGFQPWFKPAETRS